MSALLKHKMLSRLGSLCLSLSLLTAPAFAAQLDLSFDNAGDDGLVPAGLQKNPAASNLEVFQDGAADQLVLKSAAADFVTRGVISSNLFDIDDVDISKGATIDVVVDSITVTDNVPGRDIAFELMLTDSTTTTLDATAYGYGGAAAFFYINVDGTNNIANITQHTKPNGNPNSTGFGQFNIGITDRNIYPGDVTFPLTITIAVNQSYVALLLNGKPFMLNTNIHAGSFNGQAALRILNEGATGEGEVRIKRVTVSNAGTTLPGIPAGLTAIGSGTDFDNPVYDGAWDPAQFYYGGVGAFGSAATLAAQSVNQMVLKPQPYSTAGSHEGVTLLGTNLLPVSASDALHVKFQIDSISDDNATENSECMLTVLDTICTRGYFHNPGKALSIGLIRQGTTDDIVVYSRSKLAAAGGAWGPGTNGVTLPAAAYTFPLQVEAIVRANDFDLILNGTQVVTAQPHIAAFGPGFLAAQINAANPVVNGLSTVVLNNFNVGVNGTLNVPVELSTFSLD